MSARRVPHAVSPFATGGGGYGFEHMVAVPYLISLLRQQTCPGLNGATVRQVRLQQRNLGHWLDDIVVEGRDRHGSRLLSLQVRNRVVVANNADFRELVAYAWREFRRRRFRRGRDGVGIVTSEAGLSHTARTNLGDLISWAGATADADVFYRKVGRFKAKRDLLSLIERIARSEARSGISRREVFEFMQHLQVNSYDFGCMGSKDETSCHNALLDVVVDRNPEQAGELLRILRSMAEEYDPKGGEITHQALVKRIRNEASFAIPSLDLGRPSMPELLRRQVTHKLAAEKNSRKYIPDVFVETTSVKDEVRLFCHPALFLQHVEEQIRRFYLRGVNRALALIGLPEERLKLPARKVASGQFRLLHRDAGVLRRALDELETDLSKLKFHEIRALRSLVPEKGLEAFDQTWYGTANAADYFVSFEIPKLKRLLDLAQARVFGLVSPAGQGKTNFVCDLAEHFLLPRGIPCILLTGRDFRGVGTGQFDTHVARLGSTGNTTAIDQVLRAIEQEATLSGVPGVIVLDAINESDDIGAFGGELEHSIERCSGYSHIRIIFTCRSEYYGARFGNLERSSFASHMVVEKELHRQMDDEHRARLVPAYFRFFKISCPGMTKRVKRRLSEDVFLLRMFCEAYGDPVGTEYRTLPAVSTLRLDALFRTYLDRKLQAAAERSRSHATVGRQHPYRNLLNKTLEWMLQQGQYANVPIAVYSAAELEVLSQLLDEDLFLRKDPAGPVSILGLQDEVVSFTFDEFRDFLLAGYLVDVALRQDRLAFDQQVSRLTDPACTVSEGISHYLFLLSRRPRCDQALNIIRGLPWYNRAFGLYVFELEDQCIQQEDVDMIRELCLHGDTRTPDMLVSLLIRWDTSAHRRANIETMFDILDTMNEEQFRSAVTLTFREERYSLERAYYPIPKLAEHLRPLLLSTGDQWLAEYSQLARLLLYVWNVIDKDYEYPARQLFEEFARVHPEVAAALVTEHEAHHRKGPGTDALAWMRRTSKDS